MVLPDAGTKLRLVLDYLPCEACLAHPVDNQDLLCTLCARLDRQVAVRVGTRTTVLVERPAAAETPIVIPPASVAPPPTPVEPEPAPVVVPAAPEMHVRFALDASDPRPGIVEIVVERMEPVPSPVPMLLPFVAEAPIVVPVAAPEPEFVAVPAPEPEESDFYVDDIVSFTAARDEFFDYSGKPAAQARAEREPAVVREEPAPAAPAPPEDDFVFRAPPREEEPARVEEATLSEEIIPSEEVAVVAQDAPEEHWAPPPDFLADEEPERVVEPELAEEIQETELAQDEPVPATEEDVFEMEVMPDDEDVIAPVAVPLEEEALEMEVLADDEEAPAPEAHPAGSGELYRLRGFDQTAETALATAGITAVSHLSGHDAGELGPRVGLPFERLRDWVQVADLVQEVGVPFDAASALVAAGIAGPRGLSDADPDEVADRVSAFGGLQVNARDVRRWQRRA